MSARSRIDHRVLLFHGKVDGEETTYRLKPLFPSAAAAVGFYLGLVADRLRVRTDQLDRPAFRTMPSRRRPAPTGTPTSR